MTNLYFGYGSNLNRADLENKGFPIDVLEAIGSAWLPDYRPVYHYRSGSRQGGALDVTPALGQTTPGMLFRVQNEGWDALDGKEGAPHYYEQCRVTVLTADGELSQATTYCVSPGRREKLFIPPAPGYAELVNAGLKDWGLPTDAHDQAAKGELPDFIVRHLFVYGLLQSGHALGRSLEGIERRTAARIPGRLFDLGAYPGWQPCPGSDDWVAGELLTLTQPDRTLARTDQIEDFSGYGPDALYHRVLVTAMLETGESVLAWCYRYAKAIDQPPLAAGRWIVT